MREIEMAKVWNDSKFMLTCTQLGVMIRARHFVTVSDERAKLVSGSGIFRVEFDEKPTTKAKRVKQDEDAKLEDTGGHIADTVFFAGDKHAKR